MILGWRSPRGDGIDIGGDEPTTPADNRAVRNRLVRNGGEGINVGSNAVDTELRRNTADRNGSDGIEVHAASSRLRSNVAIGNAAFGINAVAGATDAGGNRARANGEAVQCVGVICA